MRILFAFTGGRGHLEPLLPIARAAQAAGHTVAFAASSSALGELGFDAIVSASGSNTPPKRTPLRAVDIERERREFRERFADSGARMRANRVLEVLPEWRPDVVVAEETDFGSMIVAERTAVPHATVLVLAAGSSFITPELVAEPLDAVRAEHGLAPDPELEMLSRHLVLSPFPPSLRDPAFPLPATGHSFRGVEPGTARNETPLVYFTLGTVFNLESGDLFARVLAGLRELEAGVVATVGPHVDPEEFAPLPDNFELEEFVPQERVLPRASAVVSHGGSGTLVGALAYGLPQVLIPMGADQPLNAERAEARGFARVLDPVAATRENVREAVADVLADPGYRAAAERLRDELVALPGPASAVELLEQLC